MVVKRLYDLYLKNRTISTDSRNITPGCLFFALKGEHFNGNAYAADAVSKGAIAAVVDEDIPHSGEPFIRVDNALHALQQLASFHRMESRINILAITGSNGKTTTKELCKAVLSKKFRVFATMGNLNNHIGVPLTLLSLKSDHEIGIIEMGANHPGEIQALCKIAKPDYGLITNIGKAHLEGFGGIQGVARAKGELFRFLMDNKKTLFLNEGNVWLRSLIPDDYDKTIRYNGAHGYVVMEQQSDPFLQLRVSNGNHEATIHTNLVGSYNTENILAALCIGSHFGVGTADIAEAIGTYKPENNRSQLIKTSKNTIVMDAYNANPSSMEAAISEFLKLKAGKRILILGEMREVGESSQTEHEEIITLLKDNHISDVICVGKAFENPALKAGYRHALTVEDLNRSLSEVPLTGYMVFIKGSRSNGLEKVVEYL